MVSVRCLSSGLPKRWQRHSCIPGQQPMDWWDPEGAQDCSLWVARATPGGWVGGRCGTRRRSSSSRTTTSSPPTRVPTAMSIFSGPPPPPPSLGPEPLRLAPVPIRRPLMPHSISLYPTFHSQSVTFGHADTLAVAFVRKAMPSFMRGSYSAASFSIRYAEFSSGEGTLTLAPGRL